MNRKKIIILLVSVALLIGVFAVIGVMLTSNTTATTGAEVNKAEDDAVNAETSAVSDKEAAEQLIDKTVSQEEVKESLGEWEKFEMSSAGCERGVYAGRFYYKDFTIFSRTYDKGNTYRIISINE